MITPKDKTLCEQALDEQGVPRDEVREPIPQIESDTPRTDFEYAYADDGEAYVPVKFALTLERELAAAKAELQEYKNEDALRRCAGGDYAALIEANQSRAELLTALLSSQEKRAALRTSADNLAEALDHCISIAKDASLELDLDHPCKGAFDDIWGTEFTLAAYREAAK